MTLEGESATRWNKVLASSLHSIALVREPSKLHVGTGTGTCLLAKKNTLPTSNIKHNNYIMATNSYTYN